MSQRLVRKPKAPSLERLARRINAAHRACEASLTEGLRHALEAGQCLTEVKARLEHGGWLKWLKEHCDVSARMAQRYLRLHREWPSVTAANATRVSHLTVRQALKAINTTGRVLSAVPEPDQERMLDLVDKGATISSASLQLRRERQYAELVRRNPVSGVALHIPANWVAQNLDALRAEVEARPAFAERKGAIGELAQEVERLRAEAERLRREAEQHAAEALALDLRRSEEQRRWNADVEAAIVLEHGPIVTECSWTPPWISDDLRAKLEACGDNEERREWELRAAAGRCVECGADLFWEHLERRDGKRYLFCHFCLEQAGETHCFACYQPLDPDADRDEGLCAACADEEVRSTQAILKALATLPEPKDEGAGREGEEGR